MSEKDEKRDERRDSLRKVAEALVKKPAKGSSVDELSLQSRRRAIAYGRARGNT